jgi:hypothetical protein
MARMRIKIELQNDSNVTVATATYVKSPFTLADVAVVLRDFFGNVRVHQCIGTFGSIQAGEIATSSNPDITL